MGSGAFGADIASKLGAPADAAATAAAAPALDLSGIPVPKMPDADPLMQQLTDQNNAALVASLQQQSQMDTASILARYGTQLAAANRAA